MSKQAFQYSATAHGTLVVVSATILVPAHFTANNEVMDFFRTAKEGIRTAVRFKIAGLPGKSATHENNSPMHKDAVIIIRCDDIEAAIRIASELNVEPATKEGTFEIFEGTTLSVSWEDGSNELRVSGFPQLAEDAQSNQKQIAERMIQKLKLPGSILLDESMISWEVNGTMVITTASSLSASYFAGAIDDYRSFCKRKLQKAA